MKYFYEECFDSRSFQNKVLSEPIISLEKDKKTLSDNSGLLSCGALLTRDQEQKIFRKYNYIKYRINSYSKSKKTSVKVIEQRTKQLNEAREFILKCNFRLILNPSNKYAKSFSFDPEELFSMGYVYMIKCIDKFDHRKGFKFSTYFLNAAWRNFCTDCERIKSKSKTVEFNVDIDVEDKNSNDSNKKTQDLDFLESKILSLTTIESDVVKSFFGVLGHEKRTLSDISKKFNLTRARIGQIKDKAIHKIKVSL